MVDIFIALEVGDRCSRAVGGAVAFSSPSQASLAAQDGAGSANGSHAQIWVVLVLVDHESDSAKGSPGILIDCSPLVGGGRFPMADVSFMTINTPLLSGHWLHVHSLSMNQPISL